MQKLKTFSSYLLVLGICFFISARAIAQSDLIKLSGPRIGLTAIGGKMAQKLDENYGAFPLITQFGWQFEWRYFSIEDGPTGVVECVPLIGGVEQGLFLPSISVLFGMRSVKGVEFGLGPNLSLSGAGIVLGCGVTKTTGHINWPINFSLVPSKNGVRFSILFGFNIAE